MKYVPGRYVAGVSARRVPAAIAVVLSAIACPVFADDLVYAEVSRLKLRAQARVRGSFVTVADVLSFAEADPRLRPAIGDKPVTDERRPPATLAVSHAQVVERLHKLGVNLSRVLISGAMECQVTLEPPLRRIEPQRPPADPAPLLTERAGAATEGDGTTLADALRRRIEADLASLGGTAEVEFEHAGREFLALRGPDWEFSIRARGGRAIGLREFSVAIRRDGRTHRTARIAARVRLIKSVVVAKRPLGTGAFVRREDLTLERRIFDRPEDVGLDSADRVVGQQMKHFVAAGEMIRPTDVKSEDLVKRSRPVTIVGADHNISIQLHGVALDSGGYGDNVRVRIGDTRKNRRELRGIVTGVATVRLAEGEL